MSTTTSSTTFKGTSSYSTDFANVISRAVAIAQLPITQLTDDKTTLTEQSDELTKLDTRFTALQTAIAGIATAMGGSSYESSVTTDNVATDNVVDVNVADGASEGVYSMNVTSIGAYETSMSTKNWSVTTDSSGKAGTLTLVVGNQNYSITPADNSAKSIADAINSSYGDLVHATTVNVATGDTRISLRSMKLGQTNLDILQTPTSATATSLQKQAATGYAVSQSTATWDASGDAATYTLVLGGVSHDITPASNSAEDVVSAINTAYGSQVRASVVDLGTGTAHDYRIRLQSTADGLMSGSTTLDLKKSGGTSLQTQQIAALSMTSASWSGAADASGSRSTYNLVVNGTDYSFTPASNSAADVASAINSLYGGKCKATVVDLGTGGSTDLRISLQASSGTTLDIKKTVATDFQSEQTVGSLATYEVNSSGVTNTSNTRDIEISDGVTATLVGTSGGKTVDITVSRSTSALNTALSAFADAYNAAATELTTQRGQSAGALQGQSIVTQLAGILSSISTYSSSGSIGGLGALGLDLGTDGQITYSQLTLMSADLTSSTGVASFLGSATGSGFLKLATDALSSVETATTGLLKSDETAITSQITKLTATITEKQAKVDAMEIQMQNQMAVSDALIASMEQQASYYSDLFSAQSTAAKEYSA